VCTDTPLRQLFGWSGTVSYVSMKPSVETEPVLHRRSRSTSAQSALTGTEVSRQPGLESAGVLVRSRSLSRSDFALAGDLLKPKDSGRGAVLGARTSRAPVRGRQRTQPSGHVADHTDVSVGCSASTDVLAMRTNPSVCVGERRANLWVLVTAVTAVLALGVVLLVLHKQVAFAFSAAVSWMRGLPWPLRLFSYASMYIILAALEFPAWLMAIGAGMLFGLVCGIVVALCCHLAAALLCLYTSRYYLRERMERLIENSERRNTYLAVNRALSRQALRFVTLMRLSPLFPFALSSMAMGVSQVQIGSFCLGTILGILPGIILLVTIGAQLRWSTNRAKQNGADVVTEADAALARHRGPKNLLRLLSIGSMILLIMMITRAAQRAIQDELDHESLSEAEDCEQAVDDEQGGFPNANDANDQGTESMRLSAP
jgi:uncharacterized membrane protein YdjX (TVP38/TMEM64 family)